jgi:hypothetical protein
MMTDTTTVEHLGSRISGGGSLDATAPFIISSAENASFVPPPLRHLSGDRSAPVVLLSAPAAVGKSTLAQHLSVASGAPLWDLSRLRLGDAVLIGSLGRAYGYDELGTVVPAISSGSLSIILDGLDEAYVRSGIDGLHALAIDIRDVMQHGREPSPAVSFVVLGRPTAVEFFELILNELGVKSERLAIEFFSGDSADALIDAQAGAGVTKPQYQQARNKLMESIEASIGSDISEHDRQSFLGYAPVLSALGNYLRDPAEVLVALANQSAQGGAFSDQLVQVNLDILRREQLKVRQQLDDPSAVSDAFFSAEHQLQMLLSDTPKQLVESGWTATTEMARQQAAEAARTALEGHPFVVADELEQPFVTRFVNTVFRDFLVAEALKSDEALDAYIAIDEAFWGGAYAPSALMALFYLRPTGGGTATREVDPEIFALIHTSLTAETPSHEEPVTLVIEEVDLGVQVSVGRRALPDTLDFNVLPARSGRLTLATPLSHLSLNVRDLSLQLRTVGQELALGPRLTLAAPQIELEAQSLWIDADAASPVVLNATRIRAMASHLEVRLDDSAALVVQANELPFPLRRYATARPEGIDADETLLTPLLDLRRLLAWFEAGPVGEVGYFKKPLDTAIRKGRISKPMLDYALRTGLLEERGKLYMLETEQSHLNRFRLRQGALDDSLREFLVGYVKWQRSPSDSLPR